MSKLIAVIDENHWICCPLEHEGYCHIAWNEYYQGMEECVGILNQRPQFCPLRKYDDAIPKRWLQRFDSLHNHEVDLRTAIDFWERENESY